MRVGDHYTHRYTENGEHKRVEVWGTPSDTSAIHEPRTKADRRPYVDDYGNRFTRAQIHPRVPAGRDGAMPVVPASAILPAHAGIHCSVAGMRGLGATSAHGVVLGAGHRVGGALVESGSGHLVLWLAAVLIGVLVLVFTACRVQRAQRRRRWGSRERRLRR
jgi:hypothetical protein